MPLVYDASKLLDADARVRAAHMYAAWLKYAENRLSGADYSAFLVELAAAGFPTDAAAVMNLPDADTYAVAIRAAAMVFVTSAGRTINPAPIASAPQSVQDLHVHGDLTVADLMDVGGDLGVAGDLDVAGEASIGAELTVVERVTIGGDMTAARANIGNPSVPAAAPGEIAAELRVQAPLIKVTSLVVPGTAPNGTIGEDASGDLVYKSTDGVVVYPTRPSHDTGWLATTPLHACLGVVGGAAPTPAQTPDIYAGTPMVTLAAPGTRRGPSRVQVWVRADKALVLGGAATGTFFYFRTSSWQSAGGVLQGVQVYFDSVTNQVAILLGATLVAGQPLIVPGAVTAAPAVRVMVWTR